ncbi:uncharacterized protein PHACADRAFT_197797 [Phanerochaete carnosa HHB-10118-sp]|uniref:F-box domain-containing protein n=1 Tax=Phanerochaete carnosa (strain HHB-10118-sp) TaxID=650164 RepID=K5VPJ9_PHACS|nr:uncharacterized protein PHACADRAFT_197797 [Phanerochaete carnosa HHB-10118-sp]EKM53363.1 hypothetical protein PHACADRAFT_197797 [Phanerochaete carnosa HHB-10118-sp]
MPLTKEYRAWCNKSFTPFGKLPLELYRDIRDLAADFDDKTIVSKFSLVSQAWSQQCRPRLFGTLRINGEEDCRILYDIVRSPLSGWLAYHVGTLYFDNSWFPGHPFWMILARLLPACHTIHQLVYDPRDIAFRCLSRSAYTKTSIRNITSLALYHCKLPSFSALLRVLGDITYLEVVNLHQVSWPGAPLMAISTTNNVCSGSLISTERTWLKFSYVRSVEMRDCTNNTAVPTWLLAAASTRHSFTRRRTAGPAVPAETWTTIKFIETFMGDDDIGHSQF